MSARNRRSDATTKEAPRVSVVVAARNSADQLPRLLDALMRQTQPREEFEVIVVDDGSDDRTAAVAEATGTVRTIRCESHVGLPRARNVGIRAARGNWIALTDADTVPDARWVELGIARMYGRAADIVAGGVSVQLAAKPSIPALVDAMNWLNPAACVERGYALGANIWAHRETFERWGLFNEQLASYGGDDREWGRRATTGGARLVYAPEVHVTHPSRSSAREIVRKAYRLAQGLAPQRRLMGTSEGLAPRAFFRPTAFLPPRRIALSRLRELGQQPAASQIALLYLAQWILVKLPTVAGDLAGELKQLRIGRYGSGQ